MSISRRDFLKLGALSASLFLLPSCTPEGTAKNQPNLILCMSDDQGWGDTGYNGHPLLKTPNLDQMAADGLRFDRFYSAGPVCSPTRGSVLTGRHPNRYGIFTANVGYLPPEEITLAEVLKEQGYRTGHFGKWHLGTLSKTGSDGNRGGEGTAAYSPPWEHGFETCFSTESRVPTWNPMIDADTQEPFGTHYWTGPEQAATENLEGDDSRVIMDRVIPFIQAAAAEKRPFFAVVWFHSPHLPIVAGPEYQAMYEGEEGASYYGTLTAMDEQMGRLREELTRLSVLDNTLLWFNSDNGADDLLGENAFGSNGIYRGFKRSLYEGGIRVPGLLLWPDKIKQPFNLSMPCVTTDFFPTMLDILGLGLPDRPYDGMSLLPAIQGEMTERPTPIAFRFEEQDALSDNQYKLFRASNRGEYELYDLVADPSETQNLAAEQPELVTQMTEQMRTIKNSWAESMSGDDYPA